MHIPNHSLSPAARPQRAAFTLVELLVVIAILGILAAMVLFALAGAEGSAKEMRTQSTISKLNNIVMRKYETYQTRRAPLPPPPPNPMRPRQVAMQRLNAIRELMRMEMPDRFTDILDPPVMTGGRSAANWAYFRALGGVSNPTTQFQGAECLYLIVTRGSDEPDVLEQFTASEIGDVDGDGLFEFIDAWGRPISFLRWAPGFVSPMQPVSLNPPYYVDHDPFDPLKLHQPPDSSNPSHWPDFYASGVHPPLFPLIYSAGADGVYDVATEGDGAPFQYATTPPWPNNPYFPLPLNNGTKFLIGSLHDADDDGDNRMDNITNHDLYSDLP